ncbi:hypothetical protein MKW98_029304 [Papaver atlanticum]|uniref:Acid phosphatase n=1 Tax=Papaver atlanticum TaxID=357466 RepID=A0AAD4SHN2_9MAGN|nr:hypothetical protein MKW98_029304 [Papaver atlanticum]
MENQCSFLFFFTIFASCIFNVCLSTEIHLLRPKHGTAGAVPVHGISCDSWRLGVETNNIRYWKTIPVECEKYVGHYMLGHLYRKDSNIVVYEAIQYAQSIDLRGSDGKDIWVFDVDETSMSNLPYFAKHGFGAEIFNPALFYEWVDSAKGPALPATLMLYRKVISLGFKVVFLTGRTEAHRKGTETNLKRAGYPTWERLILRGASDSKLTAIAYKSNKRKKLEEKYGYRIHGNIGDEWSDIIGTNIGNRTFKLPDPMYYVG